MLTPPPRSLDASIRRLALRLPTPVNYYEGRRLRNGFLPDNILVFLRRDTSSLNRKTRKPIVHPRCVLILALEGETKILLNGEVVLLGPGQALFLGPHTIHRYLAADSAPLFWIFITFELSGSKKMEPWAVPLEIPPLAFRRIGEILSASRASTDASSHALSLSLARLLDLFSRRSGGVNKAANAPPSDEDRRLLEAVSRHLKENPASELRGAEISRLFPWSTAAFRSRFKKASGLSLGLFIREWKMNRAAEFLSQGKWSVSEIAERTGWKSLFAFSRAFRKYWRKPPSAFIGTEPKPPKRKRL